MACAYINFQQSQKYFWALVILVYETGKIFYRFIPKFSLEFCSKKSPKIERKAEKKDSKFFQTAHIPYPLESILLVNKDEIGALIKYSGQA